MVDNNNVQCSPYNPIFRGTSLCNLQDLEMRMVRLEQQHDHIEDILKRMDKSVESNRELLANMNTILSNRMFLERFLKWVVATIIAGFTVVQGFNWVVEQNQFQGNNPQYVMGRDKEYPVVERRDNARD